jgi:hypothetical protein
MLLELITVVEFFRASTERWKLILVYWIMASIELVMNIQLSKTIRSRMKLFLYLDIVREPIIISLFYT